MSDKDEESGSPEHLFRLYDKRVLGFINGYVNDSAAAEDLHGLVWEKVVRAVRRPVTKEHEQPWLFTIARRTITDYSRRLRLIAWLSLPEEARTDVKDQVAALDPSVLADPHADPAWIVDQQATGELIRLAWERLSSEDRETLRARYQNIPNKVLQVQWHLSPGGVTNRINRAAERFARILEEYGIDVPRKPRPDPGGT